MYIKLNEWKIYIIVVFTLFFCYLRVFVIWWWDFLIRVRHSCTGSQITLKIQSFCQ